MALTPRLDLRQSQSLVMTPQLQQAIRLLQLSRLELIEEVGRELDNNPVLSDEDAGEARGTGEDVAGRDRRGTADMAGRAARRNRRGWESGNPAET